jgi:hypothetical protein
MARIARSALLTGISLPHSLDEVGEYAFEGCRALLSVAIPGSIESDCGALTSIWLPDSLVSLGDEVFARCSGLRSARLPEGLERLGDSLFSGCTSLAKVNIPESVTSIGAGAFAGCGAPKSGIAFEAIPGRFPAARSMPSWMLSRISAR